jgi:hypothetical protein
MNEEAIKTIHSALAAAQGEFPAIKKNRTAKVKSKRTGVEYEYSYATLDTILEAVRPSLSKHGLALRHVVTKENCTIIEAVLSFADGQELRSGPLPIPNFDGDMQALGSGLTYARRYTVTSLLGICAEEDDDAHGTPEKGGNPYRDQQRERAAAAGKASPPAEAPKRTIKGDIDATQSAADLATLLTKLVGRYPVKDHGERWKGIGADAKARLDAADWPAAHKATVHAVLDGVRNILRAPADPPPPEQTDSAAPADQPAPPLERITGWIDQQQTPDDLVKAVESIQVNSRFAGLRADAALMIDVVAHAHRHMQMKVELGDWTDDAIDAARTLLEKLDLDYQGQQTFGGHAAT